jgi:hypothetical protein
MLQEMPPMLSAAPLLDILAMIIMPWFRLAHCRTAMEVRMATMAQDAVPLAAPHNMIAPIVVDKTPSRSYSTIEDVLQIPSLLTTTMLISTESNKALMFAPQ